jgi:lipoyl(octanoyl) transferase
VRRPLSEDKIAAIGVRVQRGVTMHGFALNCDNSLLPFSQIIPCGISDAGVTTISEVLGRDVSPADVLDPWPTPSGHRSPPAEVAA